MATIPILNVSGSVFDYQGHALVGLPVTAEITMPVKNKKPKTLHNTGSVGSTGTFKIQFNNVETGSTLTVKFPKTHKLPDGAEGVLRQGDLVELPVYTNAASIDERRYELTECMISGTVEREVFYDHRETPEYKVFAGLAVRLVGRHRKVLATTHTGGSGQFNLPIPDERPLFLRFEPEYREDGQIWTLPAHERQVEPSAGFPFPIVGTVRYELKRAVITGLVTGSGSVGLKDVPVVVVQNGLPQKTVTTHQDGTYRIELAIPGQVSLVFPCNFPDADGRDWELENPQQGTQSFPLSAGQIVAAAPVTYGPETHAIRCKVTLPDGTAAANRVVRVLDENDKEVVVKTTGSDGSIDIDMGRRGKFKVTVYPDAASAGIPYSQTVSVNSIADVSFVVPDIQPAGAQAVAAITAATQSFADAAGSRLGPVGEALIDTSTYPVLTEPVSFPYPTGGGAGGGTPGGAAVRGAALGPMVEGAIREVLGWRPKPTDPKGFLSALTQSFDRLDVQGHTECKWNERSYAAQVTTDMGAVTGAQASIFARAKVAIDQSLPLVQGLYPLSPTILQEDIDSIRSLVTRELTMLGAELGIVGGPRVQRVDELFRLLLDVKPGPLTIKPSQVKNPEEIGGHIGELGRRLWLRRPFINTIQDEQNFTNFLIVIDYIEGLKQSWETYRPYFARSPGAEPFFGTQLVLMSRALTAVGEAVEEVNFAMDSVFLGPAERQTIELHFRDEQAGTLVGRLISLPWVPGNPTTGRTASPPYRISYRFDPDAAPLFIAELLDWAAALPSESAPMLDDSGKDGLIAVFTNVDKLRKLVHGSMMKSHNGAQLPGQPLPAGYKTPRVQRALGELADALDEAAKLAGQIKAREAVPRRELQDLPVLDSLQDAMQDPALMRQLAAALAPIIAAAAAAKNNGQ
jgi:hypothetical protein